MNRSGLAVKCFMEWNDLKAENLLVVCDDFNLPLGKLRLRPSGSSGSHKGLKSIIKALAVNYKNFGFDYNLYFDLVYNLMFLEYETVEKLYHLDGVADMLVDIGIDQYMRDRIKGLLEHEEGGGCQNC